MSLKFMLHEWPQAAALRPCRRRAPARVSHAISRELHMEGTVSSTLACARSWPCLLASHVQALSCPTRCMLLKYEEPGRPAPAGVEPGL